MLDIKLIRKDHQKVEKAAVAKREKCNISEIVALDAEKRNKMAKVEDLKHQRKKQNEKIGKAKRAGEDISEIVAQMGNISETIKALDVEIAAISEKLNSLLQWIPNIPQADVPEGGEDKNVTIRSWGEPKKYEFKPKPHWELGKELGLLEIDRAARMSGSGFTMLNGAGARLERALLNFMLDTHEQNGYREVAPPLLVNRKTLVGTGQLPKLENDMYFIGKDDLFLIPTSEVSLVNFYQGEIIPEQQLPIYIMGATPCFRREAGAHGKDTRGLLRVHEFKKVELIHFVKEENSAQSLEKLVNDAESVLQKLGLAYRIVLLASGDLSFASTKTYDIEVWAPGVERWLEVSSCSNCLDFQARRANIRYKGKNGKPKLVHSLNGSGVAVPRLMVALLETYQQADGSVEIPEALVPYFNGMKVIKK